MQGLYGFLAVFVAFCILSVDAKMADFTWWGKHGAAIYGCKGALDSSVSFCDEDVDAWTCYCSNENALGSFLGCLSIPGEYVPATVNRLKGFCSSYVGIDLTNNETENAYELYQTKAVPISDIVGFNMSVPVETPVVLNETVRASWYDSYTNYMIKSFDNSVWYSLMLVWWLALAMAGSAIVNLSHRFCPGIYQRLTGPISNNFRKHVLLPALYGKRKCQEASWWGKTIYMLVPSRWDTIVIVVFIGLIFAGLFADLHFIKDDPVFASKTIAFNKYEAIRSGVIGTMVTPFLVLFAGRNNILLWLTGWDYATNITYHKWISRLSFVLIFVHSVCYTAYYIETGSYAATMKETYVVWGTVGTVIMALMMFQTVLYFRRRNYETFLLIHIVFAVFYIISCWYHLVDLGYGQMIVPAIALWAFDRAARLVRMILFGFPNATVTLLSDGNGTGPLTNEAATLKVVIPRPNHWTVIPGGNVWVNFLKPNCFWQSHPFTCIESEDGKSVLLFCKVKTGITYNLFKHILQSPSQTAQIRVSVEGPYGRSCTYKKTQDVSYIAGGNGIPGLYSEATSLAKTRDPNYGHIKLHWVIRDYGSIMWFYEQLEALRNYPIETTIYLTRPSNSIIRKDAFCNSDESVSEKKSIGTDTKDIKLLQADLPHITFVEARPRIEDIVLQDIDEADKAVAFVSCGHPLMVDDVRYTVCQSLTQHKGKRIDFYEALQVWA